MSLYKGKHYLYMAVSKDKYELPIAVADTEEGLCRMLGLKKGSVQTHISHVKSGSVAKQKYFRVEIDDD